MSQNSREDENPSQPTVQGNQQERSAPDHQDIPASHQQGRTIPEPSMTQPSIKDEQWHNEQKGYWERQTRAAERLNWITGIAAGIALLALIPLFIQTRTSQTTAQTAIDQLKLTKTSLQTTERAWVTVKGAQVRPLIGSGKVPTVAMEWRNSGRSPAWKTKIRQIVSLKDKPPDGLMPPIATSDENHGIVSPDSSLLVQFTPTNLTEILTAYLKTGKVHLYTFGTITYLDIFNVEHQTSFCFWLQDIEKLDMSPCGQRNEVD
jgi:hypothetical protein